MRWGAGRAPCAPIVLYFPRACLAAMEPVEKATERLTTAQERIVMLAAAGGTHIPGRDWLQIEMYLLCRSYGDPAAEAGYGPGPAGPHSASVDRAVGQLVAMGAMAEVAGSLFLTRAGKSMAGRLGSESGKEALRRIADFKGFANGMSRDELLCYACREHPDLTEKSDERERVEANADEILLGMVWKEHIGIGLAAELMRRNIAFVMADLKGLGYDMYERSSC